MKRIIFSAKFIIGLLLFINAASAAYFLTVKNQKTNLKSNLIPAKSQNDPSLESYRKAIVKEALLQKNSEIQGCYESFLAGDYQTVDQGSVTVNWLVDSEGHVSDLSLVDTDFQNDEMTSCVFEHVSSLKFAKPPNDKSVMIVHKFNFKKRTPGSVQFE